MRHQAHPDERARQTRTRNTQPAIHNRLRIPLSTGAHDTTPNSGGNSATDQSDDGNSTADTGFWSNRRVLVTGAAGFTGRHVVAALLDAGAQVTAVVRPNGSTASFDEQVQQLAVDIRDPDACEQLLQTSAPNIDTIFHVAAVFRTVGVSREELFESHVTATENLIHSASRSGLRRFLHVSTIGVQGPNPPANASEEAAANPADDYQITKYQGEQAALKLGAEVDVPVTVVRPCAIYGAGDDRFLKIIRPISRKRFTMIGTGNGRFHLVHVKDLAHGMLQAAKSQGAIGEIITLGGEEIPTLREFVEMIASKTGGGTLPIKVPYQLVYAAGYVCEKLCRLINVEPPLHRRRVKFFGSDRSFDLTRARELAEYQPQVTLAQGVGGLVDWHKQRGDI